MQYARRSVGCIGMIGHVVSTCESRTWEGEADLVALRCVSLRFLAPVARLTYLGYVPSLLANSGIDPRFALKFWEGRLAAPMNTEPSNLTSHPSSHLL